LYWLQRTSVDKVNPEKQPDPAPTSTAPAALNPPPADAYAWPVQYDVANSIAARILPPHGFVREKVSPGSFARWLRYLPLRPDDPPVRLHDGRLKRNQQAHFAVIDIDTGKRNLQQCADAIIRLRAEYLYASNQRKRIRFNFTSGDGCAWLKWQEGIRPRVSGNRVTWVKRAAPDGGYANFRKYLDIIFAYAGTRSLAKEMTRVDFMDMRIGDVLMRPGSPGHAVIVVDMAVNPSTGSKVFLLAQSFMPAQDMHVLVAPVYEKLSPWHPLNDAPQIRTAEFTFRRDELMRLP